MPAITELPLFALAEPAAPAVVTDPDDWPLIHTYTRAAALADGVLVDVSPLAQEAGWRYPVAVTLAVWQLITTIPAGSGQDVTGRTWDVVYLAARAAQRAPAGADTLQFSVILTTEKTDARGRRRLDWQHLETLRAVVGPGDAGEPVVTIMLLSED